MHGCSHGGLDFKSTIAKIHANAYKWTVVHMLIFIQTNDLHRHYEEFSFYDFFLKSHNGLVLCNRCYPIVEAF